MCVGLCVYPSCLSGIGAWSKWGFSSNSEIEKSYHQFDVAAIDASSLYVQTVGSVCFGEYEVSEMPLCGLFNLWKVMIIGFLEETRNCSGVERGDLFSQRCETG